MSCLDDIISGKRIIIGVKDYVQCKDPESKLYINQLPGITLKQAANITPESIRSGGEFLKECTVMAARHVFDEFSQELQPYFDFNNIVESREINRFSEQYNAVYAGDRGLIVRRWRSEAARLFIEEVYVKVKQSGTITLNVIDGNTTTEYQAEVEADAINTVVINHRTESESVKIVFDQSSVESYEGTYNSYDGCSSCGYRNSKNIFVGGWNGSGTDGKNYGLGVKVHAQCYEDNILCSLVPKMYFLIWYKSGILALKEHVATSRMNHIATFTKEKAEQLLEQYEVEYREKYNILVKSSFNFLRSTKGECIKCNNTRYVQALP
jgi:hypothetical protein